MKTVFNNVNTAEDTPHVAPTRSCSGRPRLAFAILCTLVATANTVWASGWDAAFRDKGFPADVQLKGRIIVVAAGDAGTSTPAANALEKHYRQSEKFELVMSAVGLGDISKLDDAAIIKKCKPYKIDYVAVLRVFGENTTGSAVVTFYNTKGEMLTALHAQQGQADSSTKSISHGVTETTVDAVREVITDSKNVDIELTAMPITSNDAADACRYVEKRDAWVCKKRKLDRFLVRKIGKYTTSGDVKFVGHTEDCLYSISIELSHPTEDILVDWRLVNFVYNDVAIQTLPKWLVEEQEGTHRFVMTAPAGSRVRETLFAQDEECLRPAGLPKKFQKDELKVVVPFSAGRQEHKATLIAVRKREPKTEKQVMLAIPRPRVGSEPEVSFFFPFFTLAGAIAGSGATFGLVAYSFSINSSNVTGHACFGGLGFVACLAPALSIGVVFDSYNATDYFDEEQEYKQWQLKQREQIAYDKKLKELGLKPKTKKLQN